MGVVTLLCTLTKCSHTALAGLPPLNTMHTGLINCDTNMGDQIILLSHGTIYLLVCVKVYQRVAGQAVQVGSSGPFSLKQALARLVKARKQAEAADCGSL